MSIRSIDHHDTKNNIWQWRDWQGLPYLTCDLLRDWPHGFFTAGFYPASPEELTRVLSPTARAYRLQQVHGNEILTPEKISTESPFSPADGLISDGDEQALWVASADCSPVLIGDVVTGRCAALHSGWRGTAAGIVPRAIDLFLKDNSKLENLRAVVGPSISGDVYQVSEEVALEVVKTLFPWDVTLDEALDKASSYIWPDSEPGKVRLSVRRVIFSQLLEVGLRPEQLAQAPFCTYQQLDYFFSYRRTGEKKVQWSGIISRG